VRGFWELGLGVEYNGEEGDRRATSLVIPPKAESSSTSLLTLGPKNDSRVAVSDGGDWRVLESVECARSLSFCRIG